MGGKVLRRLAKKTLACQEKDKEDSWETVELEREPAKIEQIGRVTLKHIGASRTNAPLYSDGSEDILYSRFKTIPDDEAVAQIERYSSWAEEYHLSPVRHNLLKWFPFETDGTVLEVGAGCGALTGLLCSKVKKVIALEYSYKRALITTHRHSGCFNLEVVVSSLQDYESEEKFDYVTVIGVLEYARTFYPGKTPYESFLAKVNSLLKPNGTLILAIENKIGLKYIAGAPEDHTGRAFDSIYNYPYPSRVRTFSKKELTDLLNTAGFHSLQWYYPFPDYKMPQEVLSEQITPAELDSVWSLLSATRDCRHKKFLSAKMLGKTLARAGLFEEFANSFLVIAKRKGAAENFQCLRFMGANMKRKRRFRINRQICMKGAGRLFIRRADGNEATGFIRDISHREMLAKGFFDDKAEVVCGESSGNNLTYPYIEYPTLVQLMSMCIANGDAGFGKSWLEEYHRFLLGLPTRICVPEEFVKELGIPARQVSKGLRCFCCGIVDCIPRNVMIDQRYRKWYVVDNEWTFDFPVPVDFVIFRAIHSLVVDLQEYIQFRVSSDRPVLRFSGYGLNTHYMPLSWLDMLSNLEVPLKQLARWSSAFQNLVLSHHSSLHLRLRANSKAIESVTISEISVPKVRTEQLFRILKKARRLFWVP